MEKKILQKISKILKVKNINLKDNPKSMKNWDSLAHLEIIQTLNVFLKINISFEDTIKIKNVSDIIKVCKKYMNNK
ncbi:MAG: acyl carrier protein [Pseudomonadota bacterium]|nr:acyl carrier protein [Pseudomonadota bacterium]|tara:strand:- start:328 stop:555 length:228 start_codon:yes stop_codon:yes gene_type:complete